MTQTITPKVLKAPNDQLAWEDLPYDLVLVSSTKMDGNRGICVGGTLYSSSMKRPRNENIHRLLKPMTDYCREHMLVLDYELYTEESDHHAQISGCINSYCDPLLPGLKAHVFDGMTIEDFNSECRARPYGDRIGIYEEAVRKIESPFVVAVKQRPVSGPTMAKQLYEADLEAGFEGSILRTVTLRQEGRKLVGGWYKHGRATVGQAIAFKAKQYVTVDARIVGVLQRRRLRDEWPREYDQWGHLKRPLEIAAYTVDDCVGGFEVEVSMSQFDPDRKDTVRTEIGFGKGFDLWQRRNWWKLHQMNPTHFIGKHVEIDHMPHGAKDGGRLRGGRLKRFRPDKD